MGVFLRFEFMGLSNLLRLRCRSNAIDSPRENVTPRSVEKLSTLAQPETRDPSPIPHHRLSVEALSSLLRSRRLGTSSPNLATWRSHPFFLLTDRRFRFEWSSSLFPFQGSRGDRSRRFRAKVAGGARCFDTLLESTKTIVQVVWSLSRVSVENDDKQDTPGRISFLLCSADPAFIPDSLLAFRQHNLLLLYMCILALSSVSFISSLTLERQRG